MSNERFRSDVLGMDFECLLCTFPRGIVERSGWIGTESALKRSNEDSWQLWRRHKAEEGIECARVD